MRQITGSTQQTMSDEPRRIVNAFSDDPYSDNSNNFRGYNFNTLLQSTEEFVFDTTAQMQHAYDDNPQMYSIPPLNHNSNSIHSYRMSSLQRNNAANDQYLEYTKTVPKNVKKSCYTPIPNSTELQCNYCDKRFKANHMQHSQTHFDPQYKCTKCNRSFRRRVNYNRHFSTFHQHYVDSRWFCNICYINFASKQCRDMHINRYHSFDNNLNNDINHNLNIDNNNNNIT